MVVAGIDVSTYQTCFDSLKPRRTRAPPDGEDLCRTFLLLFLFRKHRTYFEALSCLGKLHGAHKSINRVHKYTHRQLIPVRLRLRIRRPYAGSVEQVNGVLKNPGSRRLPLSRKDRRVIPAICVASTPSDSSVYDSGYSCGCSVHALCDPSKYNRLKMKLAYCLRL